MTFVCLFLSPPSLISPSCRNIDLRDISAVLRDLLYLSPTRGLLYVTDTNANIPSHTLEHLSCFLPGLLALGAHRLPLSPRFTLRERERHMWAAQGLAQTCWLTYADAETGLGPDEVRFTAGGRRWLEVVEEWEQGGRVGEVPPGLRQVAPERVERDYRATKPGYFLRPEVGFHFFSVLGNVIEECRSDGNVVDCRELLCPVEGDG